MQVLMVAPTAFGFNEQTAQDNHFMHAAAQPGESEDLVDMVTREFAGIHHVLSEVHGMNSQHPFTVQVALRYVSSG